MGRVLLLLLSLAVLARCDLVLYAPFDSPNPEELGTSRCQDIADTEFNLNGNPFVGFSATGGFIDGNLDWGGLGGATSSDQTGLLAPIDSYSVEGQQLSVSIWLNMDTFPDLTGGPNEDILLVSQCTAGILETYPWYIALNDVNPSPAHLLFLRYAIVTDSESFESNVREIDITSLVDSNPGWFQVVMVYSSGLLQVYVNPDPTDVVPTRQHSVSGSIQISNATLGIGMGICPGGTGRTPSNMLVDELRVCDHAMSPDEISQLAQLTSPSLPVTVDPFTMPQPINTTVLDTQVDVIPSPATLANDLSIETLWSDQSACQGRGVARINDADTSFELDVLWDGSSEEAVVTLRFQALDISLPLSQQVCGFQDVEFVVGDSEPIISEDVAIYTLGGERTTEIYQDEVVELRVVADGFPAVRYQWKELRMVTTQFNGTSTTNATFVDISPDGINSSYFFNAATYNPSVGLAPGVNSTGDAAPTVHLNMFNRAGQITSSDITLTIRSGSRPGSGGDGDGVDVAVPAAIGSVAGVALLCCCALLVLACCVVLVALVVVAAVAGGGFKAVQKAKAGHQVKLPDPDFNNLAFGSSIDPQHGHMNSRQKGALDAMGELFDNDTFLLATICADKCKATEAEKVAKSLIFLYHERGFGNDILSHFVSIEVDRSDKEGTLFRANSISSKMFNAFAKMVGLRYVFSIFARPVNELAYEAAKADGVEMDAMTSGGSSLMEPLSLEVDPSRLDDAADATVNTLALRLTAQKLFDALRKSTSKVPVEFRLALRHVQNSVVDKFGDGPAYKAMGGFLFLRFLCPSLMAPQVYGLLEAPPSSTCQRQLILIAKIMQNLANDTLPGKKEEFMRELNAFISDNKTALESFYATLVSNAGSGPSSDVRVPATVVYNALGDLYKYMSQNHDKIVGAVAEVDEDLAEKLEQALGDIDPM